MIEPAGSGRLNGYRYSKLRNSFYGQSLTVLLHHEYRDDELPRSTTERLVVTEVREMIETGILRFTGRCRSSRLPACPQ